MYRSPCSHNWRIKEIKYYVRIFLLIADETFKSYSSWRLSDGGKMFGQDRWIRIFWPPGLGSESRSRVKYWQKSLENLHSLSGNSSGKKKSQSLCLVHEMSGIQFYVIAILYSHRFSQSCMISLANESTILRCHIILCRTVPYQSVHSRDTDAPTIFMKP